MLATSRRGLRGVECLEQKQMLAADLLSLAAAEPPIGGGLHECAVSKSMDWASPHLAQYAINGNSPAQAEINLVEVAGGAQGGAHDRWFVADSFTFGVEREMKESGENGGTADNSIGGGELHEAPGAAHACLSAALATDEALTMIYVHIPGMADKSA